MTHRFPIKEIARQAGLGPATIDRVLNNRANVSTQTRLRVEAAINELSAQEAQLAAKGRRVFFDVVIEAPRRFSAEVRSAAEALLPQIETAVCRPRFIAQEIMEEDEVVAILNRILKRGSHGVCLKARDTVKIRAAVDRLMQAKIPVVTLVTDIATTRLAYAGLDNAGAGRTAAYLLANTLGDTTGQVLTTQSHARFLGEEERDAAFRDTLKTLCPRLQIVSLQGGSGVDVETSKLLSELLRGVNDLRAVYSMGGGNRSILETLAIHRLKPKIYIAHDLDRENRALIADHQLSFILHHDLQHDLRGAFQAFLSYHQISQAPVAQQLSTVQVITPYNIPPTS